MKRIVGMILALVMVMTSIVCLPILSYAEGWPITSNIKTYPISTGNDTPVYETATSSNGRYGTIYADDLITILAFSNNRFKVRYPISGGTKVGWVDKNKLTSGSISKINSKFVASKNITVYRRSSGSATIGSVYANDTVYVIASKGSRSQILYPLDAGGMKMGWIDSSNVSGKPQTMTQQTVTENNVVYTYVTVSIDTSSMEKWIESMKKAEQTACNSGKGVIVGAKVMKKNTVSWRVSASSVYQGPGITGYVIQKYSVPSSIQYKLHSHTRNTGFGRSWYYSNGTIKVIYTCNCGYRKEILEWQIPLPDFSNYSDAQTTKAVIQNLPQIN